MAIKISGSTIIDDGRSLVNVGVSTISGDLHVGTGVTVFSSTGIVSATAYHHSDGTFLGFRQDVQETYMLEQVLVQLLILILALILLLGVTLVIH